MAEAAPAPALWLVDKPAGPTSHDVVAGVRRRLGRKAKVGHSGTLDPFATGLLVLMVGRATRLAPFLTGLDKTYLATLRTGFTSESGDPEGPIAPAGEPADRRARSPRVLPGFTGEQRQRVPALSAVRVEGERLYARTRRGERSELPEREIAVRDLRLVEDLGDGDAVAGGALQRGHLRAQPGGRHRRAPRLRRPTCTALRRTAVGDLSVDDAVAPEEVDPRRGARRRCAGLAHLPARELDRRRGGRGGPRALAGGCRRRRGRGAR